MPKRRRLLAAAILLGAAPRLARAQANLMPDRTPRLPPQPGQGLPAEDLRFLQRAARLSAAQSEAGRIAAERASGPDVRALGAAVAEEATRLSQRLAALATARGVELPGGQADEAGGDASLAALRAASGEDVDRRFLSRQLALYPVQAEMFQAAASNSPDREVARLGIEALAALRAQFETAQQLGARFGLRADTVGNPPQY
jgi:predicted outer membrane protein